ncbi:MAG: hypothetical protein PHR35_15315 [Kiritimatiellae bacterium]|nr:hypothetical protein [Kiritimatiellia bacterium]
MAVVPDTLDLAERARLGINHFTSIICREEDYEMYWSGVKSVVGSHIGLPDAHSFWGPPLMMCQPKCMEAMAMERLMSGSEQGLDVEARMIEMMLSHVGEEGIYWVPSTPGRKPWLGPEEMRPFANVHGQGRMIGAMATWYQYTGNPRWKDCVDRMVDGLDRLMVVHKDDYAYFPIEGWMPEEYFSSCYVKGRGWKGVSEPMNEKAGEEGSLFNHQGHVGGVLANWYMLTGNEQALRLSGELIRFVTKAKFWADSPTGDYPGVIGAEHAHWQGHFHGHINTLRAIFEYALATNNPRLKAFVRDGYEWARQHAFARIGCVGDGQGCGCARLIGLAMKLSDDGVGDYWEDVDLYIRNHGIEYQFTHEDLPFLRKLTNASSAPDPSRINKALEAMIGGFSMIAGKHQFALCCSPWGNMGLFFAWDGTLRHSNGVVRVNLLLNRASPWMDVDSYLPYEGKVVLKNKTAREAIVRIPLYVDLKTVTCGIGEQKARMEWLGRYLRIVDLKPGDTVTIEFPIEERTEFHAVSSSVHKLDPHYPQDVTYTCKFKGNTLIEISPDFLPTSPFYRERPAQYRAAKAPVKKVERFVTPAVLKW